MVLLTENRMKVIVGHYGSGKTEFSINYAIERAVAGKKVLLADLDIVNPFFCSHEKKNLLSKLGINVISSALVDGSRADIPALNPQLLLLFKEPSFERIIDSGGDPAGARVLGRFHHHVSVRPYEMWMVVNANRPETREAHQVIEFMKSIERSSRLKISGLINNTHMVRETVMQDIYRGNALCCELKRKTGIPVKFTCVSKLLGEHSIEGLEGEILPMDNYLRPSWL